MALSSGQLATNIFQRQVRTRQLVLQILGDHPRLGRQPILLTCCPAVMFEIEIERNRPAQSDQGKAKYQPFGKNRTDHHFVWWGHDLLVF